MQMDKYYYKGSVKLTINYHGETAAVCEIGPIEEIIEAESPSDAYAKLMDEYEETVRTDPTYDQADPRDRPIIEFNGEMTKAINSFERDEANERDG
jgi:hypothetical protein